MQIDPVISFHGVDPSDEVRGLILERARKLERYFGRITSCRVAVEVPHQKSDSASLDYHVRIDLTLPGSELVVNRDRGPAKAHNNPFSAVRDAFSSAENQLKRRMGRRRDFSYQFNSRPSHGLVRRIFRERGYGFLESSDGREIYFDRRSVLNGGFDRLDINEEVQFAEEAGEDGPQASTVRLIGKSNSSRFFPENRNDVA